MVIEIFGFNLNYFRFDTRSYTPEITTNTNATKEANDTLTIAEPNQRVSFSLDLRKIRGNKLSIAIDNTEQKELGTVYKVLSNEQVLGERRINSGTKTINIGKNSGILNIEIENPESTTLTYHVEVANVFVFSALRFVIILGILLVFSLAIYLLLRKKISLFTLISIVFFGTLSAFFIPPMFTFDERQHFFKALSVADGNLFFENHDKVEIPYGINKLPEVEAKNTYYSIEEFKQFYHQFDQIEYHQKTTEEITSTASTYLFIPYIFSAIGIIIAKILGLNLLYYIWLARLANILAYSIMVYFAIKMIPRGKMLLSFLSLQPIFIYLGASLGFDSIMVGASMVGLAKIYQLRATQKKITPLEFILITLMFMFVIICKVSYAPILLFFFLLRKENFRSTVFRYVFYSMISLALFVTALYTYSYASGNDLNQWNVPGVDIDQQTATVLHHPFWFLGVLYTYFTDNAFAFLQYSFSGVGYLKGLNPFFTILSLLVLLFLSMFDISSKHSDNPLLYIDTKGKLLSYFSFICMLILTATALYISFTRVASLTVSGYQPRYVLPIYFPLFYSFASLKIKHQFSQTKIWVYSGILILLFNLSYLWSSIIAIYYL